MNPDLFDFEPIFRPLLDRLWREQVIAGLISSAGILFLLWAQWESRRSKKKYQKWLQENHINRTKGVKEG
jgi:hypothetical protein